jgi:hypothetical protein
LIKQVLCRIMWVLRRLGARPSACTSDLTCPALFELSDGRFAVVGTEMTADLRPLLPPDAGVASYERIVVITRDVLIGAKADIPDV